MQKCHNGLKKEYNMIQEDEGLKISMQESIRAKNERLAKEKGMLRLYTPMEKEILRNGLKESELQDVGDRINEDVEQIVSKTFYDQK